MEIKVKNGNVEKAIRSLKRKTIDKLFEVRERQYYLKPSVARQKNKKAAKIREQRRIRAQKQ